MESVNTTCYSEENSSNEHAAPDRYCTYLGLLRTRGPVRFTVLYRRYRWYSNRTRWNTCPEHVPAAPSERWCRRNSISIMAASEENNTFYKCTCGVFFATIHAALQHKCARKEQTFEAPNETENQKTMFMCEKCEGYFFDLQVFNQHDCKKEKDKEETLVDQTKKRGMYSQNTTSANWNRESTLFLISEFKDWKPLLDSGKLRKKDLWERISSALVSRNYNYSPDQVCGRWKSITRAYKNVKDNNKKSGAEHKTYEYEDELDGILGSDPAIDPEFVMGSAPAPSTITAPEPPATTSQKRKTEKDNDSDSSSSSASGNKNKARKRVRKSGGSSDGESVVEIFRNYVSDQKEEWKRREVIQKQRLEVLSSLVDVLRGDKKDK